MVVAAVAAVDRLEDHQHLLKLIQLRAADQLPANKPEERLGRTRRLKRLSARTKEGPAGPRIFFGLLVDEKKFGCVKLLANSLSEHSKILENV